ncbi:14109_t:CDS:2 [Gigaspora rosea]|nr:14109_t:CDS:2 [Gigaspora rosea]
MEERSGNSSSSSSHNYDYISGLGLKSLKTDLISQADEFIKDFSKLDNLIGFKQLVEDFEIELPEEILIKALKLLSDASSFEYYSGNIMIRFETHIRTWMATLERVYYSPIVLGRELREQLYNRLSDFVEKHNMMKRVIKQGVGNSHKLKGKSKEISNNNIYMHFQNYNIDFLLIHLRDTLHSMRDDETLIDEILRRVKKFLLSLIRVSPKVAIAASGYVPDVPGIGKILPDLAQVFNFKYPIAYWYPTWRGLLSIHYSLENLTKDEDYSKLRFYHETYLLEWLWQYSFTLSIHQKDKNEILDSQNEIINLMNLLTKKEPIAPPNSLWFGVLDLAQHLCQRTSQIVSLALCYYLGLESLQNSKCTYICFKSLELLLSLSYQEPEIFKDIVQDDINKYKESLSTTSQQILEKVIHDVVLKLSLQLTNQQSVISIKEKSKIKNDGTLINIIVDELTCPITKQLTGDFLILTCGHSVSCHAIKKWNEAIAFENRLFECPFCKNEIKLESTYNFPKNKILKGLYETLEQAGCFNKSPEKQPISLNKICMIEDDIFLKFNKHKIFQNSMLKKFSTPIFQKVQPKVMLSAFNKAAKAEQQNDYEAAIMWLTQG